MSQRPPTTTPAERRADGEKTYDWDMVIACGVALLLQSQWDGETIRELLARATGPDPDQEAMNAVWAYVKRTLEPMR